MIEELKKNIEQETKIVADIIAISSQIQGAAEEKGMYSSALTSLENQLKILNNSIPVLLNNLSAAKLLSPEKEKPVPDEVVRVSYVSPGTNEKKIVTLNRGDKEKFIQELRVSEAGLFSLKRSEEKKKVIIEKPSIIARISNKIFSGLSEKLSGKFTDIGDDLKKANLRLMLSTYISITLFFSTIFFLISLMGVVSVSLILPKYWIYLWVPFLVWFVCITGFYFYPASEKSSMEKKIGQELPFATIHMAAIAGSNIEPATIFKIIASSPEYVSIGKEFRKLINQIDIYGYDLVTAMKNAAKQTSNKALSELFSGIATNIVSGGDLKNYLEKKADNYLLDYRLERQRYSSLAETFMDIYISILITAPLILMMMFIVMNVTGLEVGISLQTILVLAIGGVALINIIFLILLEMKQPKS